MNIDISNTHLVLIFAGFMVLAILFFWNRQQINAIASVVTVIGVLGTFVGIAIGLYNFDTSNIEESVPNLLDGLKIAFATSILGVFLSVLLKCYALKKKAPLDATIDDLAKVLEDILAAQKEGNKTRDTLSGKQDHLISSFNKMAENDTNAFDELKGLGYETKDSLHAIERSLTREGDSTVLTQLQKLRTTVSEKQDDLISSFDKFADKMAENNTNALIKALKGVMEDFNAKINDELGHNFKQLNEAVGKINKWQEQYRQQMDELAEQFQVAAESIKTSRESLECIAERSGAIVSNSEKLDPILQAVQHQIQQLDEHLTAFSALANNARSAFPTIAEQVNQLSTQTERIFQRGTDRMTEQITLLDKALQDELTKALKLLGGQLASLSEKFVEDYSPLTDKLHEVVQMANGIPQGRR